MKSDGTKVVLKEISLSGLSKRETETALQEAKVRLSFSPPRFYSLEQLATEEKLLCLQLLLFLKHPNIVSCLEAFQQDGLLYIVLELCSEGSTYCY